MALRITAERLTFHLNGETYAHDIPPPAAQHRLRLDETPAAGGTDGSVAPDASQGCTCDHHGDALDSIRAARTLGGHAGIAEGLAAIAHAILHGQERP